MQVKDHARSHRTVLVFDFTNANAAFVERAKRLSQSVNGNNIKADIVSIHNGVATAGFQPEVTATTSDVSDNSVQEWASAAGYEQVILSRPGA